MIFHIYPNYGIFIIDQINTAGFCVCSKLLLVAETQVALNCLNNVQKNLVLKSKIYMIYGSLYEKKKISVNLTNILPPSPAVLLSVLTPEWPLTSCGWSACGSSALPVEVLVWSVVAVKANAIVVPSGPAVMVEYVNDSVFVEEVLDLLEVWSGSWLAGFLLYLSRRHLR